MRSDHIPNHDRRLHMARCPECGELYDGADGHECADLDEIEYDPAGDRQWDECEGER